MPRNLPREEQLTSSFRGAPIGPRLRGPVGANPESISAYCSGFRVRANGTAQSADPLARPGMTKKKKGGRLMRPPFVFQISRKSLLRDLAADLTTRIGRGVD